MWIYVGFKYSIFLYELQSHNKTPFSYIDGSQLELSGSERWSEDLNEDEMSMCAERNW